MPINGNPQKQRSCLYDLGRIRQQGEWLDALRQQKSFKVAIPTYYRGKIQLLVSLYLDENNENEASVALVVALNENKEKKCWYFCPTCLSLDMARADLRVITRIDDTWLKVDK